MIKNQYNYGIDQYYYIIMYSIMYSKSNLINLISNDKIVILFLAYTNVIKM